MKNSPNSVCMSCVCPSRRTVHPLPPRTTRVMFYSHLPCVLLQILFSYDRCSPTTDVLLRIMQIMFSYKCGPGLGACAVTLWIAKIRVLHIEILIIFLILPSPEKMRENMMLIYQFWTIFNKNNVTRWTITIENTTGTSSQWNTTGTGLDFTEF